MYEMLNLIKYSLMGGAVPYVNREVYEEMKRHAIVALPASCLSSLDISSELKREWMYTIIEQISFTTQINYEQTKLPITVPYVILKGTSAAKYYPHPEHRMMGDIDIMTRREDFDTACQQLIDVGYHIQHEIYKEIGLTKAGITIDLHRQFASLNNPEYVKYLDNLIIENINSTHVLPDLINGLTLLDHINQHLEGGIGFRQIIDWMMFVDKCLPDEKWPEFYELAKNVGLEKLAVVCTHMCELYLGLPSRAWCADVDHDLCEQLLNYVMACGNFGRKKQSEADISESAFAYARNPIVGFKLLQRQGLTNWKATKEHKILKPFAWIYQLFRYISKGMSRDHAISRLRAEYNAAKRKTALFDTLGVKTAAKGIVIYKDGKYIK